MFAALLAATVALDPYDTGRFALVRSEGVASQAPRMADASRGRDPAFAAAIVGNSHVQMLSPAELSAATGIPFLSLAVPGTGPREQLVLLDYFLRHRPRPAGALVLGIDEAWCTPDPALTPANPFPYWLYGRSDLRYVTGLVRYSSLGDAASRLGRALRLSRRTTARRDGYWSYDEGFDWRPERQGVEIAVRQPSTVRNETGRFPALDALGARLAALPATLPVVLVRPPVAETALPRPGSPLAASEDACWAAVAAVSGARPRTALVDWRVDRPEVREPRNFIDRTHMRSGLARLIEADVAAEIRRLSAP